MKKILKLKFYQRPAPAVAQELLGKFLVREIDGKIIARMITETEAYCGPEDLASHTSKGLTKRTKALFEAGGIWYVYFIYGLYWLLNIVAGEKGSGDAVLIRGVEGVNGPGRVAKFFRADKQFYGLPADKGTHLYIEDRGIIIPKSDIIKSARIGVNYAGPLWSKKEYRFYLKKIY